MKPQFTLLIIAFSFAFSPSLLSADRLENVKISAVTMKLAMLDLHNQDLLLAKKTIRKNKRSPIFSSDCTEWTDWQIKQKAQPFNQTIIKFSRQYGVDSNLVKSVIIAESCFKTKALSHANARGLMQLIPATAKRFGVKDSYSAEQNIRGGVKYLKFLLNRYQGDLEKTIAAYNAGEGKVDRYNGIPPYKETKQYVKNVLKVYARLKPKIKTEARNSKPIVKRAKKSVYHPPKLGNKAGRHGWQFNRKLAPHLYKH